MALNSQTPPPYFSSQWPSLVLENFRTIDEFQAATVAAINNIASAGNALGNQLNQLTQKQNTDQQNDAADLNDLQDQITKLQQQVGGLTTSFQTLQSDNAQFKSNITAQIQNFQNTLDGFQGQLTALQQATSQNTTDISKLKSAYDPTLWDQMTKAFQNIGLIIANAINDYDKTVVQPALSKIRTDLATQGTKQAEAITEIALDVEELAILVRRATIDWTKLAQDLQNQLTQEVKDREAMGERNYQRITHERTRAIQKETAIEGEIVALQENVDQNKKDAADGTATVKSLVTAETDRAKGEEQILSGEIADNKLAIDTEVKRANTAESNLQTNINAENERAQQAESNLQNNINIETNARKDADATQQQQINNAVATSNSAQEDATTALNTVTSVKEEADANQKAIADLKTTQQIDEKQIAQNQSDISSLKQALPDTCDITASFFMSQEPDAGQQSPQKHTMESFAEKVWQNEDTANKAMDLAGKCAGGLVNNPQDNGSSGGVQDAIGALEKAGVPIAALSLNGQAGEATAGISTFILGLWGVMKNNFTTGKTAHFPNGSDPITLDFSDTYTSLKSLVVQDTGNTPFSYQVQLTGATAKITARDASGNIVTSGAWDVYIMVNGVSK